MSSKPHTPNLDPPSTTPSLSPHPSPDSTMDALLSAVDEILSRSEALLPMVERLKPIIHALEPLQAEDVPVRKVVESLYAELRLLRTLCKNGSSGGLVEDSVHNLGKWVDQLIAVWTDAPSEVREGMDLLRRDMMDAQFGEWSSSAESGGGIVPDVEDLVLRVKKEEDEELGVALLELGLLVRKGMVGEQAGTLIGVLLNRLGNVKNDNRWRMLVLLRRLAMRSEADKEKMSGIEALSSIVRSLTRDVGESREAVGLLMDLSVISKVRQRIGRVQGCIMMLVTLLNGDDPCASDDAGKLLCALSSNTQNVLLMAEAGYFVPLVQYLKEGSDMNKILMATAISRIELTDQMKRALGEEGSIEPLVKMFTLGKLEAKLSALGALRHLSSLTENIPRLIKSGILESLLQLLFSVTSVLMTLREPAAAILASLAQSDQILIHKDVTQQMLSLLNLSSPAIQFHLLQALNSIASHSNAKRAKAKMKENGAVQLLLPFLIESNAGIRTVSLNLLFNLSKDFAGELTELLGDTHLNILVGIISSSTSETEKAAAVGILSNLPVKDKKATDILIRANLLSLLINLVGASVTTNQTPTRSLLLESIASVMIRFTVPWDKKLQKASAAVGIIPCLIKLLSGDSAVAKSRSATSLAQLSQNTLVLSKAKSSGWLCVPPSSEAFCEVHNGYCGVKSTFCLLKSGAVSPLLRILEGKDREADEAVLSALATLMQDEIWENGSNSIEKASGVQTIIRVVEVGSLKAQEKAVWMLERIFRIGTHKVKYGGAAQILLIDLAQKGDPTLKPMIAKTLAHLQLLQMQSSYF